MINSNFVILGALLNLIGASSYIVDTLKGRTKPNRITWLLWSVIPLIAFTSEINQGVGIQSLMTFIVGFSPLLILIFSFLNKKSYWKLGRLDIVCGFLSLAGLLLWYLTRDGNFAILFSIMADGLAALPTIVKSYNFPETESSIIFILGSVNAAITLATITTWNFAHYGFPVYILLVDIILAVLIRFKLGKLLNYSFRSIRS